jgi:hypothetical protein
MFGVWPLRILRRSLLGFWRFVVSAISTISTNPSMSEVMARIDQLDALRKLLEVALLRRMHRMRPKERNDLRDQIRPPAHHIAIQVLAVVVVTAC